MAFSLNRVMLIGNLGNDAETRFTTSGKGVTSFSIATTHSYKKQDGSYENSTTWHNIIAWSQSDFMKDKLVKGAKFYVEGRISKRDYVNKEGTKVYITEVIAEKLIPLSDKEGGERNHEDHQSSGSYSEPENDPEDPNNQLPF